MNTDTQSSNSIAIDFYDNEGTKVCTLTDTVAPLAAKGYWMADTQCNNGGSLPSQWVGGAVVRSTNGRQLLTLARPHVGNEVTAYNGFSGGLPASVLPALYKSYDGNESAFYVQNIASTTNNVTIDFYNQSGTLQCSYTDTIGSLAVKGYWMADMQCNINGTLPAQWEGSAMVRSNEGEPLIAIVRPHMGLQISTYNGGNPSSLTSNVPMAFNKMWGYNTALYFQNASAQEASVEIKYYDMAGNMICLSTGWWLGPYSTVPLWIPNDYCND